MDKLHLDRALTPAGWRDNVTVTVGGDGRIAAIAQGPAPAGAPTTAATTCSASPVHGLTATVGTAGVRCDSAAWRG